MIHYRRIGWEDIHNIWANNLWPNRETLIEPCSALSYPSLKINMEYMSGPVHFWGAYVTDTLIGVNSGHQTGDGWRSRGLWVHPQHRGAGVANTLLNLTVHDAILNGAQYVWSLPRKTSFSVYQRVGFIQVTDWLDQGVEFGPNCVACINLNTPM